MRVSLTWFKKVAKRISNSNRNHATKRQQIADDCRLIRSACPNLRKLNVVLHHKVGKETETLFCFDLQFCTGILKAGFRVLTGWLDFHSRLSGYNSVTVITG